MAIELSEGNIRGACTLDRMRRPPVMQSRVALSNLLGLQIEAR